MVKKFYNSSKISQILCLIIPIFNWITEIIVRFSAMIHRPHFDNIVMFILSLLLGQFIGYIDLLVVAILGGKFIFMKI